jgi:hypothetical protein
MIYPIKKGTSIVVETGCFPSLSIVAKHALPLRWAGFYLILSAAPFSAGAN